MIIFIVVSFWFVLKKIKNKRPNFILSLTGIIITSVIAITCNQTIYANTKTYDKLLSSLGIFHESTLVSCKGLIYTLLNDAHTTKYQPPEGYSKNKVNEILEQYEQPEYTEKIPNVIAVMCEAYADIQDWENIKFTGDSPYQYINYMKRRGCYGSIVVPGFAGATATYTIESLMHSGFALQAGTSHNFGDGFAKAFDIQFTDKDNQLKYVHQTSWGLTTRLIGAIIMVHGDDNGLILPPKVAPIQVAIIPIAQHKEGVLEKANELKDKLCEKFRVKLDDSDYSTGWKFSQYEMKGVPLRLELGPRDIENNSCVLVSRVSREKKFVSLDNIVEEIEKALLDVHNELVARARKNLEEKTSVAHDYDEFLDIATNKPGFIKAMWCGESECEEKLKDVTGGVKSRCIPFVEDNISDKCVCCGKPAKHMVVWGRQY